MKIHPPPLLDELVASHKDAQVTVGLQAGQSGRPGTRWYIARPLEYLGWQTWARRVYHAWLVLRGRARAYQYIEDRL